MNLIAYGRSFAMTFYLSSLWYHTFLSNVVELRQVLGLWQILVPLGNVRFFTNSVCFRCHEIPLRAKKNRQLFYLWEFLLVAMVEDIHTRRQGEFTVFNFCIQKYTSILWTKSIQVTYSGFKKFWEWSLTNKFSLRLYYGNIFWDHTLRMHPTGHMQHVNGYCGMKIPRLNGNPLYHW